MSRFYAFHVPSWELVDADLQLSQVSITRALSTPKALDATISRKYAHLVDETGQPVLKEWGTVIVAELAGRLDVFIVDGLATEGDQEDLSVTAGGVASYLKDQPFLAANTDVANAMRDMHRSLRRGTTETGAETGGIGWRHGPREVAGIEVDPLNMVRAMWRIALAAPRADIRLSIDGTTSPERIGEEERDVEFETSEGEQVEFTAGPYKLTWHDTDDMGGELDNLADETPFEWWEESAWDGELPSTQFRIAYPSKPNVRKDHLFFEIGTNIVTVSQVEWSEHADVVLVTGQGDGSDKVRSHMADASDRLRRVQVHADRGIASRTRAQEKARRLLQQFGRARTTAVISEATVVDSHAARFGTFDLGDVITVRGNVGWTDVTDDYRIVSISEDLTAETQTLSLELVTD